ncbi:class I SAM-dependent methyltransferase [Desulfobacula sp.]|uniref:class I SAM-dependent methyltransferase n=1 Tax=Desulfobacula sp. TaxID=2593537 RepID=UPI00261C17CE|nr:class I SAM-dependent methyltransferase [Desulfobacula sp.]
MSARNILKSLSPNVGKDNESSRETWLKDILLTLSPHSRILDAGAGTQRYREYCHHLDYVSQDFGDYDGKGDTAALQTGEFDYGKLDIVSDITSIPEPTASFDAIMCIEVLEHLADPVQAIKEFSRLLKPNGHLIMTAPFCSLTHLAPYHFSSGFNTYWYESHLSEQGFKHIEISRNGNFFEFIAQEIYRIPSISSRYSDCKPNPLELFSMFILQRMLLRFSKRDNGSSELLCFGCHVHARKD